MSKQSILKSLLFILAGMLISQGLYSCFGLSFMDWQAWVIYFITGFILGWIF